MQAPLVSFVMPAFNAERTIRMAIMSVLTQTEPRWELIIVNDGSTDNTVMEASVFQDPRIRIVTLPENRGIAAARNYGNSLAKSHWIMMQDADDCSMPNRLSRCLKAAQNNDVVCHGIYMNMWDAHYSCMNRVYIPARQNLKDKREEILKHQMLPGAVMFKKSLWQKKPFREETKYAFDWMMHIDWIYANAPYCFIDEGLYEYIRHENSASITYEKDGRRVEAMNIIKEIIKKEYAAR